MEKEIILNYLIEKELEAKRRLTNCTQEETNYFIGYIDAIAEIYQYVSRISLEEE